MGYPEYQGYPVIHFRDCLALQVQDRAVFGAAVLLGLTNFSEDNRMPFVLIVLGVCLFITALNGTFKQFGSQLYKDLFVSTPKSQNAGYQPAFIVWILALLIVGLIGYIPEFKKVADLFMALIIVVMVVANKGFGTVIFQDIETALQQGPQPQSSASPLAAIPVSVNPSSAPLQSAMPSPTSIIGAH